MTSPILQWTDIVQVAAAYDQAFGLKADGTVLAIKQYQQIETGLSNIVAMAAAGYLNENSLLALKSDGTMASWGTTTGLTNFPPELKNAYTVASGRGHALALVSKDRVDFSCRLLNSTYSGDSFNVSFQSRSGKVYLLEYKDSLDGQDWTALPLVAGNGRELTLTAPAANGQQRFYRVRQW